MILASIPSPSVNVIEIGPIDIHFYGILIGIGVIVAMVITERRYLRFGGDPKDVEKAAFWAVVIGFLGARMAYVSTHLSRFEGRWLHIFAIWEGGLAFFGGLTGGAIAAIWVMRRRGGNFPAFADAVAIGLPAAQAIGRFGNYFNQELFGTPTDLPWGLEIERRFRPAEYLDAETFHPTFLYEGLWNMGVILLLLTIEKRFQLKRGSILLAYFVAYGVGRFLMELLRTDTTFRVFGISRNGWVSVAIVIGGSIWLRMRNRISEEESQVI
ncbi:MAG: prolipoprotein diacylglyceryl transferase [Acidimicrobiia bacterium]|nr:prolipoprotein diacylglyceryl transferase [Acidimicrobiia bacterium]